MSKKSKPTFASSSDALTFERLEKVFNANKEVPITAWRVNSAGPNGMTGIELHVADHGVSPHQFYFNRKEATEASAEYLGIKTRV